MAGGVAHPSLKRGHAISKWVPRSSPVLATQSPLRRKRQPTSTLRGLCAPLPSGTMQPKRKQLQPGRGKKMCPRPCDAGHNLLIPHTCGQGFLAQAGWPSGPFSPLGLFVVGNGLLGGRRRGRAHQLHVNSDGHVVADHITRPLTSVLR